MIRIGINSGGLMAGVVGIRNPRFKLFGDTVNVASRMETTNLPGQIQITAATHSIIKEKYFTALRGKVFVKGRGDMDTYFLRGRGNFTVPPPPSAVAAVTTAPAAVHAAPHAVPATGASGTSMAPNPTAAIPNLDGSASSVGSARASSA